METLAKPGGRFLELDGFKVYYVDRGSGATTYVLLHGFGASTFSWRYFLEELPSYCLLYTSPSPRDRQKSRMPSSA